MHLSPRLRKAIQAMSDEELAIKYVIAMAGTVRSSGLLNPSDLHYELYIRVGGPMAKIEIDKAREILKMVGSDDLS